MSTLQYKEQDLNDSVPSFCLKDGTFVIYCDGELIHLKRSNDRFQRFYYEKFGTCVRPYVSEHDGAQQYIYEAEKRARSAIVVSNRYTDKASSSLYRRVDGGLVFYRPKAKPQFAVAFATEQPVAILPGSSDIELPKYVPDQSLDDVKTVFEDAFTKVVSSFALAEEEREVAFLWLVTQSLKPFLPISPILMCNGLSSTGKTALIENLLSLSFKEIPAAVCTEAAFTRNALKRNLVLIDDQKNVITGSRWLEIIKHSTKPDYIYEKSNTDTQTKVVSIPFDLSIVITSIRSFREHDLQNRTIVLVTSSEHFCDEFDPKSVRDHASRIYSDFSSAELSFCDYLLQSWHEQREEYISEVNKLVNLNNGFARLNEALALMLCAANLLGEEHVKRLSVFLTKHGEEHSDFADVDDSLRSLMYVLDNVRILATGKEEILLRDLSNGLPIRTGFTSDTYHVTCTPTTLQIWMGRLLNYFDPKHYSLCSLNTDPRGFMCDLRKLLKSPFIKGVKLTQLKKTSSERLYRLEFTPKLRVAKQLENTTSVIDSEDEQKHVINLE